MGEGICFNLLYNLIVLFRFDGIYKIKHFLMDKGFLENDGIITDFVIPKNQKCFWRHPDHPRVKIYVKSLKDVQLWKFGYDEISLKLCIDDKDVSKEVYNYIRFSTRSWIIKKQIKKFLKHYPDIIEKGKTDLQERKKKLRDRFYAREHTRKGTDRQDN